MRSTLTLTLTLTLTFTFAVGVAREAAGAPKVLLCTVDTGNATADIKTKLVASNLFATVDTLDCGQQTPSLQQLLMYDAVLTFDSMPFADRATLGTNLANYVDMGGGVVNALFDLFQMFNTNLAGGWSQGAYDCINPGNLVPMKQPVPTKAQPNDAQSPLVQGVTGISTLYFSDGGLNQKWNATSVWDYSNGQPFVCKMLINGHPRVDLNFLPGPNYYTDMMAGDGGRAIANALLFVSGGFNPIKGAPNPVAFPNTATNAVSNPITVTYTNTSMQQQTVNSLTVGGANAADFLVVKAPQLPLTVNAMGTFTVDVEFQPTAGGGRSALLKAGVVGQMFSADVTLTGNAIPSSVKVAPYPLAFGGTQTGQPVQLMITISNTGQQKVTIQNVQVTQGQAAYSLSGGVGFPVALIAGGGFQMTATFNPQMNGITKGILTVTSDDPNTPTINVPMSGYAGPPAITLDANSIAFGGVNLGASTSQVVNVTNSGFSDLHVSAITVAGANPNDFPVDKMMAVGTIPAQQSQPFTITFKPTMLGNRTATVTVSSDDAQNPTRTVTVFGTGTTSMLTVAPMALTFAPVHVKTPSPPQNVTISNAGNGTLKVMSLAFGGMDASSFSQKGGPAPPFTVGPNASVQVGVIATPQKFGKVSGTLAITTDVGNATVTLDGEGTAPVIAIAPATLDFGMVRVATPSMAEPVTITNNGTDDLTINLLNITGPDGNDFSSKDLPATPIVIKPMGTTTFHLTFTPSKSGMEMAELDFLCDDPANMQPKLALTGAGVQAGLAVSPMTVDFKTVPIATISAPLPVTITNTGDVPVNVSSVALGGAAASSFKLDQKGPFQIDKGMKQTVNVTCSPLTVGLQKATMTITADNLVPIGIGLQCTGVGPNLQLTQSSVNFGDIAVGTSSSPQMIGIKNGGAQPVAIDAIASTEPSFTVDKSATTTMLMPGATTTFAITFSPAEAKTYGGNVAITVKGSATPVATVAVVGNGVMMAAGRGCGCAVGARREAPPVGGALLLGAGLFVVVIASLRRRRSFV